MKDKLSFEEALKQLEDITVKMESGEIPLDESIELYEKAKILIKYCEGKLENIENRIGELSRDENGKFHIKHSEEGNEKRD